MGEPATSAPALALAVRRPRVTHREATRPPSSAALAALASLAALADQVEDDGTARTHALGLRAIAACKAIRDARVRSDEVAAVALACAVADEDER